MDRELKPEPTIEQMIDAAFTEASAQDSSRGIEIASFVLLDPLKKLRDATGRYTKAYREYCQSQPPLDIPVQWPGTYIPSPPFSMGNNDIPEAEILVKQMKKQMRETYNLNMWQVHIAERIAQRALSTHYPQSETSV